MRRYTVAVDGTSFTIDVEETAADRFLVTVGDRTFEATLASDEDLPGAPIEPGMPTTPERPVLPEAALPEAALSPAGRGPGAVPASNAALPRTPAGTPGVRAGGPRADVLAAPMPGVVLEVNVSAGTVLRRGDPVLVLEAMKMRNTIRAPAAAVVLGIEVEAGEPVGAGDPLVRLGPPAG